MSTNSVRSIALVLLLANIAGWGWTFWRNWHGMEEFPQQRDGVLEIMLWAFVGILLPAIILMKTRWPWLAVGWLSLMLLLLLNLS